MARETQLTLVGLGAALLLVFNLPEPAANGIKNGVRELLAPYQAVLASAGAWRFGSSTPDSVGAGDAVSAIRLQRLETLERENDELRELLALSLRVPVAGVAAAVVARDGDAGWWRTVRLNRGYRDGIQTNQVVVAPAGVVGVVREVSPHTADVLLITDSGCRLSIRCNRTGDFGLVRGGGAVGRDDSLEVMLPAEPLGLTFVPRDSSLRPGDEVVTSGLGVFPAGLRVGVVTKVDPARSGLYLDAEVRPAADLNRIRHVLVLTGRVPSEGVGP